ncbi:MAG: HDOD domain-containing protein [bacterium]
MNKDQLLEVAKRYHPLDALNDQNLSYLLESVCIKELPPGTRLTSRDDPDKLNFLVKGQLALATQSGPLTDVTPDDELSFHPLFCEGFLARVAVTKASSVILSVDKGRFEELQRHQRSDEVEVKENESGQVETTVFQQIYAAYEADKLELPAFPEVALKVRNMLSDPDVGINDLVDTINTDPTIAGKLLQVSNSPMYRGNYRFTTVRDAVVRLGLGITSQIVSSAALKETFSSDSKLITQMMHSLWEHSVTISALSSVIAQHVGGLNVERALFTGLVHDVGAIPVLKFADKKNLNASEQELDQAVTGLRDLVGVLVVNTWELGPEVATVVAECEQCHRDPFDEADYCDVVLLAHIIDARRNGEEMCNIDEVPAAAKLKLSNWEQIDELLEKEHDTIAALTASLS